MNDGGPRQDDRFRHPEDAARRLAAAGDLAAYDVQAGRDVRDPALQALLQRFAAAARANLPPPPEGLFVTRDWQLDLDRIRPLLGSQSRHVISVGE